MHNLIFYKDEKAQSQLLEHINELKLKSNNSKDSRIKFNKIVSYLNMLERNGLELGEPYIKHIVDELWELRPLRYRIFFTYCGNDSFILLHYFLKKTQKTPQKEIDIAKFNFKKFRNGGC